MNTDDSRKDDSKKEKAPSAAELEADLEAKRAQLAATVDQLTAQLDPRQNLADLKAQVADTAANLGEEAQAFAARVQSGDQRALEIAGYAAVAVCAVVGLLLIRGGE